MLLALFDRRYTLRTRLFTAVQPIPVRPAAAGLKDACRLPGCLLPVIVYILQQSLGEDWGRSFYPFVRENSPCIPLQELGVVREDALLPDGFCHRSWDGCFQVACRLQGRGYLKIRPAMMN